MGALGSRPSSTKQAPKPKNIQASGLEVKPMTALSSSKADKKRFKLLLGQLEDDSQEEDEIIYENVYDVRPPARQKELASHLGEHNDPVGSERRPINISTEARPPSRHRTPPKALGLDLPPSRRERKIEVEKMYTSNSLNGTFDEIDINEVGTPLLKTMPVHLSNPRSESSKSAPRSRRKTKDRSCVKSAHKTGGRIVKLLGAWETESGTKRSSETSTSETNPPQSVKAAIQKSGAQKTRIGSVIAMKQPVLDIPIVLNKRKYTTPRSRRQKAESAWQISEEKPCEVRSSLDELNHSKRKEPNRLPNAGSKTLSFKSSLDAEFLSLFS